ncbi:hypothetical protein F5876DRAFT_70615 [Lentinula aff. lateritia]|uniref:Uncharacterized protein n=1 Tax=Lentinula aff. lateritia TaxID=2804960 RepID=A0ACC1TI86_9AGAR|nr:hypothetical protein F5876DRAFT_70615 [Lentinula aff. lateritia]
MEYHHVLDQFSALDRALSRSPGQCTAVGKLSASSHRSPELLSTQLQQQGLMDEADALATRQHQRLEELQEEVHQSRNHMVFVEQMVKEYPDEGFYKVALPPLSQLEGDLDKAHKDLRRVATFAHRLYSSNLATVLYHHSCYIGVIIEAVVTFLHHGLDSADPNVVAHNFCLALNYMQTACGIYGDIYMHSISSIQWYFNNAVDKDKGLYHLVLKHS